MFKTCYRIVVALLYPMVLVRTFLVIITWEDYISLPYWWLLVIGLYNVGKKLGYLPFRAGQRDDQEFPDPEEEAGPV